MYYFDSINEKIDIRENKKVTIKNLKFNNVTKENVNLPSSAQIRLVGYSKIVIQVEKIKRAPQSVVGFS